MRYHTINALFLMKQDPNESVYDPALVSLLESVTPKTIPKTTSKTAPTKDTKVVTPDSKAKTAATTTPPKEPEAKEGEGAGTKQRKASKTAKKPKKNNKAWRWQS